MVFWADSQSIWKGQRHWEGWTAGVSIPLPHWTHWTHLSKLPCPGCGIPRLACLVRPGLSDFFVVSPPASNIHSQQSIITMPMLKSWPHASTFLPITSNHHHLYATPHQPFPSHNVQQPLPQFLPHPFFLPNAYSPPLIPNIHLSQVHGFVTSWWMGMAQGGGWTEDDVEV